MIKLFIVVYEFVEFGYMSQVVQMVFLGDSKQLLVFVCLLLGFKYWGLYFVYEVFYFYGVQSNSNDVWDSKKEDNFVYFGWL